MSWKRVWKLAILVLVLAVASSAPGSAQPRDCPRDDPACWNSGPPGVDFGDDNSPDPGNPGSDPPSGPDGDPTPVNNGPQYEYAYVISCPISAPPGPDDPPGFYGDVLCMGAVASCPDEQDLRYRAYRREVGTTDWVNIGSICRGPNDPAAPQQPPPPTPRERAVDYWDTMPLNDPVIHTRPTDGAALVNLTAYFWATGATPSGGPGGFTVTDAIPDIPGLAPVQVRATAVIQWSFGDGGGDQGQGQPWPARSDVNHTYGAGGNFTVTANAVWSAEFSEDGGATWEALDGTQITSDTVDYTVREVRTVITD